VLASGVSSSNVGSIHTALFKYSDTEYELNITVYRGLLAIMEPWCVSIITSKIPDTVKINLKPDYVTL
jgi:hypothetical protein